MAKVSPFQIMPVVLTTNQAWTFSPFQTIQQQTRGSHKCSPAGSSPTKSSGNLHAVELLCHGCFVQQLESEKGDTSQKKQAQCKQDNIRDLVTHSNILSDLRWLMTNFVGPLPKLWLHHPSLVWGSYVGWERSIPRQILRMDPWQILDVWRFCKWWCCYGAPLLRYKFCYHVRLTRIGATTVKYAQTLAI